MTEARALSLHQPWASLVAVGVKSIETRSLSTKYRGPLLIHAAKRPVPGGLDCGFDIGVTGVLVAHGCVSLDSLPLGAVVASCQLVDCVPIRRGLMPSPDDGKATVITNREGDGGNLVSLWTWSDEHDDWNVKHYPQRPFGDFMPGRYAWLFEDVKPTTERCPRCWGSGGGPADADERGQWADFCPTCGGSGWDVEPVPMRGRQGLWAPVWDGDN